MDLAIELVDRFMGIWFIKAVTEESFSLTGAKPRSLQELIAFHVDSSQSDDLQKNIIQC